MMPRSRTLAVVASILGLAVLAQQVFLIQTNRSLRLRIASMTGAEIQVGSTLTAIVGVGLDGRRVAYIVTQQPAPTLVLTMSPGCPASQRSLSSWNLLARIAADRGMGTVVVSKDWMSTVKRFVEEGNRVSGLWVVDPTHSTFVGLRLNVVPHVLILQPSGEVSHVWVGAVDPDRQREIAKALEAL